jgi:hypothetical protein
MRLLDYFKQFLKDSVNLNKSRLGDLDSRVDSITLALKESPHLDGRVLDTVPQGSWAHQTIIRPGDGLEFDADFLVQLTEDLDWNDNPRSYADAVWSAMNKHSIYGNMSKKKDRCVRVVYANDCHIDIVTYLVLSSGREVIVNRTTNEFEDTNPIGFTEWIQEKDDLTGGDLRKVIRLLKYLRDRQSAFSVRSVLLTTMVGNVVDHWRTYDSDYYKDVPTTLLHVVKDLDDWLQANWTKPSITDPSCPTTTFDHRWTDAQYSSFRNKVHELRPKVEDAYHAGTVVESIAAWQTVFGPTFPNTLASRAAAISATAALTKSAMPQERAPNEQFIEEMLTINETHRVSIVCEVSAPRDLNRAQRRALKTRAGRVPKRRDLLFKLVDTDVAEPFKVYWKVRNRGDEAAQLNKLRGEIAEDEGLRQKRESTLYTGHHYVECYIVKNGVCVARAREPVIIT